jgi:hypothetical protein
VIPGGPAGAEDFGIPPKPSSLGRQPPGSSATGLSSSLLALPSWEPVFFPHDCIVLSRFSLKKIKPFCYGKYVLKLTFSLRQGFAMQFRPQIHEPPECWDYRREPPPVAENLPFELSSAFRMMCNRQQCPFSELSSRPPQKLYPFCPYNNYYYNNTC